MYKVERAIIMAAGKGERMKPLTADTPKPLIKVNGVRMIETVIHGLLENGIYEIYVVVGYLKEQFYYLKEKYKTLQLIENAFYGSCNNISSLYVAREYLENVIILDGDQIIYQNAILRSEFEKSGYNAVWTEEDTKEWLMQEKEGRVVSCSRIGGEKGWKLYSISRWTKEDGRRLRKHLELEFEKNKNYDIYWDDVVMFCHFEEYELGIMPMEQSDIKEIDTLDELILLDRTYEKCRRDRDE